MKISSDVVILTKAEYRAATDREFQRGVARGRFEQNWDNSHGDNPQRGPSKDKLPASPDAGGGPIPFDWTALAKALFEIEHDPTITDQAWFDFQGKAQRILAIIQQQQS